MRTAYPAPTVITPAFGAVVGGFDPINFAYQIDVWAAVLFTMTRDTISAVWVKQ